MRLVSIAAMVVTAMTGTAGAQAIFNIVSSPSPNIHGNTLNSITAITAGDAWAVGFQNDNQLNGSRTLTMHWNSQHWTVVPSPNPGSPPSCTGQNSGNMLNAAAAVSTSDVWAVGFQFSCTGLLKPMILHWNGVRWSNVNTPPLRTNDNSALNGVLAFSSTNVYAVGYQPAANGAVQTLVEHWDGVTWSVIPTPNGNNTGSPLLAISGTSPTDIWVVGARVSPNKAVLTLTEHFDGTTWTVIPSPSPNTLSNLDQNVITSVQAISPTDVTAVGYTRSSAAQNQLTLIEHWDGSRWRIVTSPNESTAAGSLNTLTSISGSASNDLYAVGYFGDSATNGQHEAFITHFDGLQWSIVPAPRRGMAQHVNGVFALPGTTDVWTVGAFSTTGDDPETGLLQVPQTLVMFTPAG